jgi:hypothetical protein
MKDPLVMVFMTSIEQCELLFQTSNDPKAETATGREPV